MLSISVNRVIARVYVIFSLDNCRLEPINPVYNAIANLLTNFFTLCQLGIGMNTGFTSLLTKCIGVWQ